VTVKAVWNSEALYLGYEVTDAQLDANETMRDGNIWLEDAIEWFIDTRNNGGGAPSNSTYMLDDDYHGIVNILNTQYDSKGTASGSSSKSWNGNWESTVIVNSKTTYNIEIKIPWTTIGFSAPPDDETTVGMSFALNDKDGTSHSALMWPNITTSFENASKWQQVLLSGKTISKADDIPPSPPAGLKVSSTGE